MQPSIGHVVVTSALACAIVAIGGCGGTGTVSDVVHMADASLHELHLALPKLDIPGSTIDSMAGKLRVPRESLASLAPLLTPPEFGGRALE